MTDNVEYFSAATGKGQSAWVHLKEIISFRYSADFGVLDKKAQPLASPDGSVIIDYMPQVQDSSARVQLALLDDNAQAVIGNVLGFMFDKAAEPSKVSTTGDIPKIIPNKTRKQIAMLNGLQATSVLFSAYQAMYSAIDEQFPTIGRLRMGDLTWNLFLIAELRKKEILFGDEITELSNLNQKTVAMIESRVQRLRTQSFGSEWVKLQTDHNLSKRMTRHIEGTLKQHEVIEPVGFN